MQRALIQYRSPKNYYLVKEALIKAHRQDLIGTGPKCLIRAIAPKPGQSGPPPRKSSGKAPAGKPGQKPAQKAGQGRRPAQGSKPAASGKNPGKKAPAPSRSSGSKPRGRR